MPSIHQLLLLTTIYLSISTHALPLGPDDGPVEKEAIVAKRTLDRVLNIFARDGSEFIGFHGTNSDTAAFWEKNGFISLPPSVKKGKGTSGSNHELGDGLYITDDPKLAAGFAEGNRVTNKAGLGNICAVYAKSSRAWRKNVPKVLFPTNLAADAGSAAYRKLFEDARVNYLMQMVPEGTDIKPVVRFNLMERSIGQGSFAGQMMLPTAITRDYHVECYDANRDGAVPAAIAKLPDLQYSSPALQSKWNIITEDQQVADCVAVTCEDPKNKKSKNKCIIQ